APRPAAEGEHPRCPGTTVVGRPANDGGVTVGGERDGPAWLSGSSRAGADQLSLLAPRPAAAGEHPCRASAAVIGRPAHNALLTRAPIPLSGRSAPPRYRTPCRSGPMPRRCG